MKWGTNNWLEAEVPRCISNPVTCALLVNIHVNKAAMSRLHTGHAVRHDFIECDVENG